MVSPCASPALDGRKVRLGGGKRSVVHVLFRRLRPVLPVVMLVKGTRCAVDRTSCIEGCSVRRGGWPLYTKQPGLTDSQYNMSSTKRDESRTEAMKTHTILRSKQKSDRHIELPN